MAFRAAVAQRGLSLDRLRAHLQQRGHDVSVATLSYWQSGRSAPERAASRAALAALEEILQVETQSLSCLLVTRARGRASSDNSVTFTMNHDLGSLVDQGVAELGLSWRHGLQRVVIHDQLRIGADRTIVEHRIREVVRATQPGVDRWPIYHGNEELGVLPQIQPVTNCRVGRTVAHPEQSLLIAEMLLERPLARGESLIVEYTVFAQETTPTTHWRRSCADRMRELHMEVHFDPRAIPTGAERVYGLRNQHEKTEPVVIRGQRIDALLLDFGPGSVTLRWNW